MIDFPIRLIRKKKRKIQITDTRIERGTICIDSTDTKRAIRVSYNFMPTNYTTSKMSKARCLLFPLLLNIVLEVLARRLRQGKKLQIVKEEIKLYLLTVSIIVYINTTKCFPGGSVGKESTCNAGDPGSVPGSGRSLGEGNGNPLHYFCLGNLIEEPGVPYSPWRHRVGYDCVTKPPPRNPQESH